MNRPEKRNALDDGRQFRRDGASVGDLLSQRHARFGDYREQSRPANNRAPCDR
jgi:hypothetical protein